MPRILISTQVYPPEIHPTAVMVRELAEHLAEHGHQVQVVAGYPHHGRRRLYEGFERKLWERTRDGNVDVLRTWHVISSSKSIIARSSVFATQALGGAIGSMLMQKPDVVLVVGPPLFGPCLAALVARKNHAKLVNVIHDLHPDIAIEQGLIKNQLLIKAARAVERFQYRHSDLTIVLTDGFKETLIERGVVEEKIVVLPVWLDPDEIVPMDRDNAWRREQGIGPDKIVVLYAGTIGWVSGASIVVDTAERMKERKEILFLFVGDGAAKDEVETEARSRGLKNMKFLPFQPRERLPEVQAASDISLVTLAPGRGRTSVPSKVQGYMAAQRPIVASVGDESETGKEIISSKSGIVTPAGDVDSLVRAVGALADSSSLRAKYGSNARKRLEEHFARGVVLEKFRNSIEKLANRW